MISGYVLLNIALIGLLLWAQTVLKRFLTMHSSIESTRVLEEFKNVARWSMYGALGFLVFGGLSLLLAFVLMREMGLVGALIVLAISVPSLMVSLRTRTLEKKSRNLPCADNLRSEYQRVSDSWVKRVLPDF